MSDPTPVILHGDEPLPDLLVEAERRAHQSRFIHESELDRDLKYGAIDPH